MRAFITLDEYWDYRTGTVHPDYDIGKPLYPLSEMHYIYDWDVVVPAPSGTRFRDYLTSHSQNAQELLLNVRRFEREVSDGVISYEEYENIFACAVEYCKELAPNIRWIECCNEVDIARFGMLTPDEYVKIFLCCRRAINKLNAKHNYPIPLQLGGYASAHPLTHWSHMAAVIKGLHAAGEQMDFYAYHMYDSPNSRTLITENKDVETASLSGVNKLKRTVELHRELLRQEGLQDNPIFFNEIGRAKATGVDGDSLHNAAGNISYLLALDAEELRNVALFPWCTFHNPQLQMSYTQYLLKDDGSYVATPNGIAMEMLHKFRGQRLQCTVSGCSHPDASYFAGAAKDEDTLYLICTNPTGDTVACETVIEGLEDGQYISELYRCDRINNNCITGDGDGTLAPRNSKPRTITGGTFRHMLFLESDSFQMYILRKIP